MRFDELESVIKTRRDSVVGGGASPSTISDAEKRLAVSFPGSLREYLRRFGWLELGHMELFGLGDNVPPHLNLTDLTVSERAGGGMSLPGHLIPLLNDGGGNLYCMDASEGSGRRGRIVLFNHELGARQEPRECAPTLEDWLSERLEFLEES
jgi:cell wall assembly regulator SMI1